MSFSKNLLGVAWMLRFFRHFCTYELMKTFVSADFFINFYNIIYISQSTCFPKAKISSFRQIKAFLETLERRL